MTDHTEGAAPRIRARKSSRKSNNDTWKSAERELASRLGGYLAEDEREDSDGNKSSERIPVTGRRRGSAADIKHPRYSIEVKHGKQIPALLIKALAQAVASVRGDRIPLVLFHPHNGRYDDTLVIVRLKDLPRVEGVRHSQPD